MTDDRNTESYNSYSSQLWYTAVCYILQFILISALRFFSTGRFDKQSVQHSAADTLLLTSVFILLQWSGILFSYGIYRLPHVMVHLLVDLIPTLAWVFASELAMLMSFAVAFKLYHHLAHDGKVKLKRVTDCMGVNYLKSISSHQNKLHHATKTYIKELFPRLVEKSNYTGNSSPGLALVFAVLFHLLELSTIGLVLLNTIIELTKTRWVSEIIRKPESDHWADLGANIEAYPKSYALDWLVPISSLKLKIMFSSKPQAVLPVLQLWYIDQLLGCPSCFVRGRKWRSVSITQTPLTPMHKIAWALKRALKPLSEKCLFEKMG